MDMTTIRRRILPPALLAVCATLSGCFDDNYDLSDIDTTAKITVDNLVLPIRIEAITLGDIINIDDDSRIVERDGSYVLVEEGTFDSDPIRIDVIDIVAPVLSPIDITAQLDGVQTTATSPAISYNIGRHTEDFSYSSYDVSECIKAIDRVNTDFTIRLVLGVTEPSATLGDCDLIDLTLQLPAGLQGTPSAGTYDANTGIVNLGTVRVTGGQIDFSMTVTTIDTDKAHITFSPETRSLTFADEIGVAGGRIVPVSVPSAIPQNVHFTIDFDLSRLKVKAFTGVLSYDIDGLDIDPVSLGDLPSVLAQPETDIALTNPQIYLSLNNPLSPYGISAQAGLTITPWRDGSAGKTYGLDRGTFAVGAGQGAQIPVSYCMAPEKPASYIAGFEGASFEPYSGLRDILRGAGLPDELAVRITDPVMTQQKVTGLPIGTDLGTVHGHYTLYAPLALAAGSQIVYTDTESGWSDEDVDAITIETLAVTANVTNNLPVSVHLSGYPIDVDGRKIDGVEISGADIKAGATSTLDLHITGSIRHFDGITFTAKVISADANTPISPSQKIELTDIKAKVSGYYVREL